MKKETVFLIGGSGFIGKNLAAYLQTRYEVFVFDKYIDDVYFDKYEPIKTHKIDLVKSQLPVNIPSPAYIINLASIVTAERNLDLFDDLIASNLNILLNLFHHFKGEKYLKLFIQFGSSEEYGVNHSPFGEDAREIPNSPYALVKQLTTNTALMLHQNYGFPAAIVRPGNLFGPMQSKEKFIPYVVEQLKNNAPLDVSPCMQKRDFIYIDEFSSLVEKLMVNSQKCIGEIINVSSGKSISLRDIIEYCRTYLKSDSVVNYGALPYRENEIMDLRCSIKKLQSIINEDINVDIKKGLASYIDSIKI